MGYGRKQMEELRETIERSDADLVLIGTPIDLRRVIELDKPALRVTYRLQEIGEPTIAQLLAERGIIERRRARSRGTRSRLVPVRGREALSDAPWPASDRRRPRRERAARARRARDRRRAPGEPRHDLRRGRRSCSRARSSSRTGTGRRSGTSSCARSSRAPRRRRFRSTSPSPRRRRRSGRSSPPSSSPSSGGRWSSSSRASSSTEDDPAFAEPDEADRPLLRQPARAGARAERGWAVREEPDRGWRRVVPSPRPLEVLELEADPDAARERGARRRRRRRRDPGRRARRAPSTGSTPSSTRTTPRRSSPSSSAPSGSSSSRRCPGSTGLRHRRAAGAIAELVPGARRRADRLAPGWKHAAEGGGRLPLRPRDRRRGADHERRRARGRRPGTRVVART